VAVDGVRRIPITSESSELEVWDVTGEINCAEVRSSVSVQID
jgi:hypothetical protein